MKSHLSRRSVTLKVLLTLLLMKSAAVFAVDRAGGGDVGGGTEAVESAPAWFVEPKDSTHQPISICILRSTRYPLSAIQLQQEIQWAFRQWSLYIADKAINERAFVLPTDILFQSACSPSTELRFYFGVEDDVVTELKKSHREPFGFAHTVPPNNDSHRKKGLVWIASHDTIFGSSPFLACEHRMLRALIFHEVGHIYGNDHVSGTIMSKYLRNWILASRPPQDPRYPRFCPDILKIDWSRELSMGKLGTRVTSYVFDFRARLAASTKGELEKRRNTFIRLYRFTAGKEPLAPVTVTLRRRSAFSSDKEVPGLWDSILLSDGKETVAINPPGDMRTITEFNSNERSFLILDPTTRELSGLLNQSHVVHWTMTNASGEMLTLNIEYNTLGAADPNSHWPMLAELAGYPIKVSLIERGKQTLAEFPTFTGHENPKSERSTKQ